MSGLTMSAPEFKGLTEDDVQRAQQILALRQLILEVIAEMSVPVDLCQCSSPTVSPPDHRDWCACTSCHKAVSLMDVLEGRATRQLDA
jgi:hypothetical protein